MDLNILLPFWLLNATAKPIARAFRGVSRAEYLGIVGGIVFGAVAIDLACGDVETAIACVMFFAACTLLFAVTGMFALWLNVGRSKDAYPRNLYLFRSEIAPPGNSATLKAPPTSHAADLADIAGN
jgi:hypothetical protein